MAQKEGWDNRIDLKGRHAYFLVVGNSILNRKFRYSYSNASWWLVGANVLVFILTEIAGIRIRGIPLKALLSLVPSLVSRGWVWQLATYMFVHASYNHLLFNMLGLLMFGIPLERRLGSKEFALFYLVSGTLSGLASFAIYKIAGTNVMLMGASGAIYALMFLFAVMNPRARFLLFWFIPVPAPVAVAVFAAMCVFNELFTFSNVANLTHLAGFAVAWLYCRIRFRIDPIKVWRRYG